MSAVPTGLGLGNTCFFRRQQLLCHAEHRTGWRQRARSQSKHPYLTGIAGGDSSPFSFDQVGMTTH